MRAPSEVAALVISKPASDQDAELTAAPRRSRRARRSDGVTRQLGDGDVEPAVGAQGDPVQLPGGDERDRLAGEDGDEPADIDAGDAGQVAVHGARDERSSHNDSAPARHDSGGPEPPAPRAALDVAGPWGLDLHDHPFVAGRRGGVPWSRRRGRRP